MALGNWTYGIYLWQASTHYAVVAIFAAIAIRLAVLRQSSARRLVLAIGVVVVGLWALIYPTSKCHFATLLLGWIAAHWSLCGLKFASCYRKHRGRAGVIMDKVQALEELRDKAYVSPWLGPSPLSRYCSPHRRWRSNLAVGHSSRIHLPGVVVRLTARAIATDTASVRSWRSFQGFVLRPP